jgi:hypothetical protein
MQRMTPPKPRHERRHLLMTRLRSRQLDLALRGRVRDSARYASRVHRVTRAAAA